MTTPATIAEAIDQTARGPAEVTVEGNTVRAQDIEKQIAADRYLAGSTAASRNHGGLRFVAIQAPGAG